VLAAWVFVGNFSPVTASALSSPFIQRVRTVLEMASSRAGNQTATTTVINQSPSSGSLLMLPFVALIAAHALCPDLSVLASTGAVLSGALFTLSGGVSHALGKDAHAEISRAWTAYYRVLHSVKLPSPQDAAFEHALDQARRSSQAGALAALSPPSTHANSVWWDLLWLSPFLVCVGLAASLSWVHVRLHGQLVMRDASDRRHLIARMEQDIVDRTASHQAEDDGEEDRLSRNPSGVSDRWVRNVADPAASVTLLRAGVCAGMRQRMFRRCCAGNRRFQLLGSTRQCLLEAGPMWDEDSRFAAVALAEGPGDPPPLTVLQLRSRSDAPSRRAVAAEASSALPVEDADSDADVGLSARAGASVAPVDSGLSVDALNREEEGIGHIREGRGLSELCPVEMMVEGDTFRSLMWWRSFPRDTEYFQRQVELATTGMEVPA
jgi:hypothetical protein